MTTYKITGTEAIRLAERDNLTLKCAANPVDDGGIVTVEKAREIAKEDPSLIYVEVEPIGWTSGDSTGYYYDDYFPRGKYTGPDCYGIEPIFANA